MDLFVTWDGQVGPGISYNVEYRPYPSNVAFIQAGTTANTYFNLTNLVTGFYEIRVRTDCANADSAYIYKIEGKDPCPDIKFNRYEVLADNDAQQTVRIYFDDYSNTGRIKVTNLTTNQIYIDIINILTSGYYDLIMGKTPGQNTAYKIEIANICNNIEDILVDMGTYTVVGPPAQLLTTINWSQDFNPGLTTSCGPSCPTCNGNRPASGLRVRFAEAIPQAVTIYFRYCAKFFSGAQVCSDAPLNGPGSIKKVTIPAGTKNWDSAHYREATIQKNSLNLCIIDIQPAVLNNNKKIVFSNATTCASYNTSAPISDLNAFPNNLIPPCIS